MGGRGRVKLPGSKVKATHSYYGAFSGLNDADSLVTAGGTDEGAISAPVHTVDGVRVHVGAQRQHGCPRAHVPHQDHIVATWAMSPVSEARSVPPSLSGDQPSPRLPLGTCTEQHVLGRGVPGHDAHALGVALQGDDRLPQGQRQAPVGDLPHLQRRGE